MYPNASRGNSFVISSLIAARTDKHVLVEEKYTHALSILSEEMRTLVEHKCYLNFRQEITS